MGLTGGRKESLLVDVPDANVRRPTNQRKTEVNQEFLAEGDETQASYEAGRTGPVLGAVLVIRMIRDTPPRTQTRTGSGGRTELACDKSGGRTEMRSCDTSGNQSKPVETAVWPSGL